MSGLSATTARVLPEEQHLAQSINDILSTPLGSRVMRRDYGSDLPRLIDAPLNGETLVDLFAATAEAIDRWEPRFDLRRVEVADAVAGKLSLTLTGEVLGLETVLAAEVTA
jgi:phage baseplate assembly protein W